MKLHVLYVTLHKQFYKIPITLQALSNAPGAIKKSKLVGEKNGVFKTFYRLKVSLATPRGGGRSYIHHNREWPKYCSAVILQVCHQPSGSNQSVKCLLSCHFSQWAWLENYASTRSWMCFKCKLYSCGYYFLKHMHCHAYRACHHNKYAEEYVEIL